MSLFDLRPLTVDECRARLICRDNGSTVRKISASGKVYTVRHQPWWKLLGKGPAGYTCGECHWLRDTTYHDSKYFKCKRQVITHGPGTDIRKSDEACRLFHIKGVSMFTIKSDHE